MVRRQNEHLFALTNHHFYKLHRGIIIAITGSTRYKTGCGKSYTALKIGELTDRTFNIDKVVYKPSEFLKAMDKIEETGKVGQVVVIDEGEITAPSNSWYSFTNRALFYTMATFRVLRCMAIWVTPSLKWIDSRIRTLIDYWGYTDMEYVNGKKVVILKLYKITTDITGEKIYFRKIKTRSNHNKDVNIVGGFVMGLPSQELIDKYEAKSRRFKSEIRKAVCKDVEKLEKAMGNTEDINKDFLDKIANDIVTDRELFNSICIGGKPYKSLIKKKVNQDLNQDEYTILLAMVKQKLRKL